MVSLIATLHVFGHNLKQRLTRDETGATAVEYALLVGLIAVVLIAGLSLFGRDMNSFFTGLVTKISTPKITP